MTGLETRVVRPTPLRDAQSRPTIMILPAYDLGSPALANATLRHSLEGLVAVACLMPRVAVRDTTGTHADVLLSLVKTKPGVVRVEGVQSVDEAVGLLDAGAPMVVVAAEG